MSARIDFDATRRWPHPAMRPIMSAAARVLRHGRSEATDHDPRLAAVELHEGGPGAVLQIDTRDSCWMLIAARPLCVVERQEAALLLSAGDVFLLPAGARALLHGGQCGEWIALRLAASRNLPLDYREHLPLVRLALELSAALQLPDNAFTLAQRARLSVRMLRELHSLGPRREPAISAPVPSEASTESSPSALSIGSEAAAVAAS